MYGRIMTITQAKEDLKSKHEKTMKKIFSLEQYLVDNPEDTDMLKKRDKLRHNEDMLIKEIEHLGAIEKRIPQDKLDMSAQALEEDKRREH